MQTPVTLVAILTSLETYFVANKLRKCVKIEFFYFFYRSMGGAAGICMDKTQINISNKSMNI